MPRSVRTARSLDAPATTAASDRLPTRVALFAAALLLPGCFFDLPDGVTIAGALAWRDGAPPCSGFWTMYAPGSFGLLAALFACFGEHLLVAAFAAVALLGAATGAFAALLQRAGVERRLAAAAALLFALSQFRTAPTLTGWHAALLLLLLGANRLLAGAPLAGGALLGLAAWFKHDVAAYVAAALIAAQWLAGAPWRVQAVRTAAAAAGVALIAAAWLAWTAGSVAWRDLILFPLLEFGRSRPERYPELLSDWSAAAGIKAQLTAVADWLRHHAPPWAAAAALLLAWRRAPAGRPAPRLLLIAAPLATFAWFAAAHVQINTHVDSMALVTLGLLAAAWQARADATAGGRPTRTTRVLLTLASLAFPAALLVEPARMALRAGDRLRHGVPLALPAAAGVRVAPAVAAALQPLAAKVAALTATDEPIWIGVGRHDALLISAPRLYLLLDRRNATRYGELHPAVVDREPAQREILADLDRHGVRVVVLWHVGLEPARFDTIRAQRMVALPGTGATLLDETLARDWRPVGRWGEYEVRIRR